MLGQIVRGYAVKIGRELGRTKLVNIGVLENIGREYALLGGEQKGGRVFHFELYTSELYVQETTGKILEFFVGS
jgi:hypothetical protein